MVGVLKSEKVMGTHNCVAFSFPFSLGSNLEEEPYQFDKYDDVLFYKSFQIDCEYDDTLFKYKICDSCFNKPNRSSKDCRMKIVKALWLHLDYLKHISDIKKISFSCFYFSWSNLAKHIGVLLIVVSTYACSSDPKGFDKLKELCKKDAGIKIYKTVETEGYYDSSTDCDHCWNDIISNGYQYVEFCNSETYSTDAINEPGCWRVYRVPRESGLCNPRIDKRLMKHRGSASYDPFIAKECIATEKIENPTSRYVFNHKSDSEVIKEKGSYWEKLYIRSFEIKDRESNETLAFFRGYTLAVNYRINGPISYGCSKVIGVDLCQNKSWFKDTLKPDILLTE